MPGILLFSFILYALAPKSSAFTFFSALVIAKLYDFGEKLLRRTRIYTGKTGIRIDL
jgi:hypothetical protein